MTAPARGGATDTTKTSSAPSGLLRLRRFSPGLHKTRFLYSRQLRDNSVWKHLTLTQLPDRTLICYFREYNQGQVFLQTTFSDWLISLSDKMATGQVADEAFVTLATNDTYSLGALVLAHSLRNVQTTRKLAIMISPQVTSSLRQLLVNVYDHVIEVDVLDSRDTQNLALLTRPDLGVTFTKFHCWRLTEFSKCVFLDADTLVLQNVDDLFDREELSAAPDAGWPDCFNSGVFVFVPNEDTYTALVQFAVSQGSFDGGDQGLLNLYFNDWSTKDIKTHLPFTYNVVSQAFYSYLPAFKQFRKDVKIVHFIGAVKPWCHTVDSTGHVQPEAGTGHSTEFLNIWWRIFLERIQPNLDPSLEYSREAGIVGELAKLKIETGSGSGDVSSPVNEREWQYAWERGQIDYLGRDSFSQIMSRIDQSVNGSPKSSAETGTTTAPAPAPAAAAPAAVPAQKKKARSPPKTTATAKK